MNMGFVCLMGMLTVFIGLICIILLCMIFSAIVRLGKKDSVNKEYQPEAVTQPAQIKTAEIPDRQKVLAAVCAVLAEELGTDVSALRVHSFRKL